MSTQRYWLASLTQLCLFTCFLLTVLWFGWLQWSMAAYRSVQMEAMLVAAERVSQTIKSGGGKLVVEYRYTYKGNNYVGNQVAFGSRWFGHQASSDLQMQRAVDSFRTGASKSIQIWVDPDDPQDSALLQRAHPGLIWVTLFVALALAIGALNAFFEVKKLAKARRRARVERVSR